MPKDEEELEFRKKIYVVEKQLALLSVQKNSEHYEQKVAKVQQELNSLKNEYSKYKIKKIMEERGVNNDKYKRR